MASEIKGISAIKKFNGKPMNFADYEVDLSAGIAMNGCNGVAALEDAAIGRLLCCSLLHITSPSFNLMDCRRIRGKLYYNSNNNSCTSSSSSSSSNSTIYVPYSHFFIIINSITRCCFAFKSSIMDQYSWDFSLFY